MSAPVRPDLASVQPLFYAAIEEARFTVNALCRRLQVPAQELQTALDLARVNGSTHAVLDRLVLFPQPGGAVLLAVVMHVSLSLGEATAYAETMRRLQAALNPQFDGRCVIVFESRPNLQGAMQ